MVISQSTTECTGAGGQGKEEEDGGRKFIIVIIVEEWKLWRYFAYFKSKCDFKISLSKILFIFQPSVMRNV